MTTREVSAVLLSLGEPTTARAQASIERQTYPVADIVPVKGLTPFHVAFNHGASRVRTPYFCQVDADMELDEDCIEQLLECMRPDVGVAAGHLRDPLLGRISCVKLFRTECFLATAFADTISPDTDFLQSIHQHGWRLVYALRYDRPPHHWHTFGRHDPDYSPLYTFRKYKLEGRRYGYRGDPGGLRWHLDTLLRSRHPAALIAAVGLAQGVFLQDDSDGLGALQADPELHRLTRILEDETASPETMTLASLEGSGLEGIGLEGPGLEESDLSVFRRFRALAVNEGGSNAAPHALARAYREISHRRAWLACLGYLRGLLASEAQEQSDLERLRQVLAKVPWRP